MNTHVVVRRLLCASLWRRQIRTVSAQKRRKITRDNMPGQKWLLHFAHENSYLSWSRNAVISMAAAGSCLVAKDYLPMTKMAGEAFTDVGLIFMTVGTGEYIYHTWKFRGRLRIPPSRVWWVTAYSLAILAAWAYGASHLQRKESLWSHFTHFRIRFSSYVGLGTGLGPVNRRQSDNDDDDR